MRILAQLIIPDSVGTWIQGLGRLGLIRLGVVLLGLVVVPDSVWTWMHGLGGLGLILVGLADNTPFVSAPPGSEDVFLILLSAHHSQWWVYYAFMATVGEVLGGYLGYRLAAKGGQKTFEKKVGKPRAEKIYKYFEKRGFLTVLTGAILPPPFPFSPVVMAAGVMQYPRKKFLSALFTGRAARFLTEAFLGRVYGQQMISFFSRHYRALLYVLISVLVAAGIGALVYFVWYRPNQRRRSGGRLAGRKEKTVSGTQGI
ncbi:MAG TPA: VTT domain-containing protein [Terriglobia bacterium]|nr:VTT domain-containing protein [Terriglobia bacterium]